MGWLGGLGFVIDVCQLVCIFLSMIGVGYIGLGCCRFCGLFLCVTVFGLGFITFLYTILSQTYYIILDMYKQFIVKYNNSLNNQNENNSQIYTTTPRTINKQSVLQ